MDGSGCAALFAGGIVTFEDAVRQALSEMTNPEAPHSRGDIAAAARHVNACSLCALKLKERLAEMMQCETDSSRIRHEDALIS